MTLPLSQPKFMFRGSLVVLMDVTWASWRLKPLESRLMAHHLTKKSVCEGNLPTADRFAIKWASNFRDMQNCGSRIRRECRERFLHQRLQGKPPVNDTGMHIGITNTRWRGKRSRYSWHMRNPQFYASDKRPIVDQRPWWDIWHLLSLVLWYLSFSLTHYGPLTLYGDIDLVNTGSDNGF